MAEVGHSLFHGDLIEVLERLPRKNAHIFHGPRAGRIKPDTVCRILVRDVITPLTKKYPTPEGERGFKDGRVHSFRHYFCSTCANRAVPERVLMDWLGHADSEMIRNYYHLHDEESQRQMNQVDFLGAASGRSAGEDEDNQAACEEQAHKEVAEPSHPEKSENDE